MGWGDGSEVMSSVISSVSKEIPDEKIRKRIYTKVMDSLYGLDWDTDCECLGLDIVYDNILREKYPRYFDDSQK